MAQRLSVVSRLVDEIYLMTVGLGGASFAMYLMVLPVIKFFFTHSWAADSLPNAVYGLLYGLFYLVWGVGVAVAGIVFYFKPETFGQRRVST